MAESEKDKGFVKSSCTSRYRDRLIVWLACGRKDGGSCVRIVMCARVLFLQQPKTFVASAAAKDRSHGMRKAITVSRGMKDWA